MLTLALLGLAAAQDVELDTPTLNAQLYRPPVSSTSTLWTEDTTWDEHQGYRLGLLVQYVNQPMVYVSDGERVAVVSDLVATDLTGGFTWNRIRVGAHVPLYLYTNGDLGDPSGPALGDIGLDTRVGILEREGLRPGVAAAARLTLPTLTVDAPLGSDGVGWELSVLADLQAGPVLVAANTGWRHVPGVELENVALSNQLAYRIGAGMPVTDAVGLSLDVGGQAELNRDFTNVAGLPLEALAGGWFDLGQGFTLRAGLGAGLSPGIGSPVFRVLAGVSWAPDGTQDRDLDGIPDRADACPTEPEDRDGFEDDDGCPDLDDDDDGIADSEDGCRLEPEDSDGYEDLDGCPDPDNDGDGLLDGDDACPVAPEDFDGVSDDDGCPDDPIARLIARATDPDGQPLEATWALDGGDSVTGSILDGPVQVGTHEATVTAPGYAPARVPFEAEDGATVELYVVLQASLVQVSAGSIDILQKVYFETAKAVIKPESFRLLDEVASVLVRNPDMERVRVEGHTDSRGSATYNQRLSEARAKAVRDYLVAQGVDAGRLVAVGYGESLPVDPGQNEGAWERNRRVVFTILGQQD